MTEEQKYLLEMIVEELGGKISHYTCIDRNKSHKQIVIDYAEQKRQTHTN